MIPEKLKNEIDLLNELLALLEDEYTDIVSKQKDNDIYYKIEAERRNELATLYNYGNCSAEYNSAKQNTKNTNDEIIKFEYILDFKNSLFLDLITEIEDEMTLIKNNINKVIGDDLYFLSDIPDNLEKNNYLKKRYKMNISKEMSITTNNITNNYSFNELLGKRTTHIINTIIENKIYNYDGVNNQLNQFLFKFRFNRYITRMYKVYYIDGSFEITSNGIYNFRIDNIKDTETVLNILNFIETALGGVTDNFLREI